MKKYIYTIIFVFTTMFTGLFAQIPNFSFETWTNMGSYEVPGEWGTMNHATSSFGVYTCTKGSPGNPGSYYLKLTSKTIGSSVVNGIAVSGVLDSITMLPVSGFAFNQRPLSFTGKWQHMIFGNSQGSLSVMLTRWDAASNQRVTVATANHTLVGMAMNWANFTINFNYSDVSNPDSCMIILKASGSNPTNSDYLWVDNLSFAGTATGINTEPSFLSRLNCYPNPASTTLNIKFQFNEPQLGYIELCDLTGRVIIPGSETEMHGEFKQTLDISAISKGLYFLRIVTNRGTMVQQIAVE